MAITPLPEPPQRGDPASFAERADAFMAALPAFAVQANELQGQVNTAAEGAALNASRAADSQTAASQSASGAQSNRQAADQAAQLASSSKTQAQAWAAKTDGPVENDEFSAKHYARLAAQGMGLPIVAAGAVPTSNNGPIYITGRGPAEWSTETGEYRPSVPRTWSVARTAGDQYWVKLITVSGSENRRGVIHIAGASAGYGSKQGNSAAVGIMSITHGNFSDTDNLELQYLHSSQNIGMGGATGESSIVGIVVEHHNHYTHTVWVRLSTFSDLVASYVGDFEEVKIQPPSPQAAKPAGTDKSWQIYPMWTGRNFDPGNKAEKHHTHTISGVEGLTETLAGKQAALGYTPVNRAGDTSLYGTLQTSGKFKVAQTGIQDYSEIGNDALSLGNNFNIFRFLKQTDALALYQYAWNGSLLGRVFGVAASRRVEFDELPFAQGIQMARKGDQVNHEGDSFVITLYGNGTFYAPDYHAVVGVQTDSGNNVRFLITRRLFVR